MVYINSRGEVIDDTRSTPTNIFWKFITFIVLFFKSLVGIEDKSDKKSDGPTSGSLSGGGFFGGNGGGGGRPGGGNNDNGTRKFGPRGFKSVTDLSPPPTPMMGGCSSGGCG